MVILQFYSLPFCSGTGRQRRHKQDLGETLSGSRKVATPYDLTFLDPVPWRSLCEEYLDAKDVSLNTTALAFFLNILTLLCRLKNLKMLLRVIFSLRCSSTICPCGATWARLSICFVLFVDADTFLHRLYTKNFCWVNPSKERECICTPIYISASVSATIRS